MIETHLQRNDSQVSFDDDQLILVNEQDQEIGFCDKASCHQNQGTLHRAFSLFIFNDEGHLLLQRRSQQKRLWPLYWSNSCCSHPRKGETMEYAVSRRLKEELGLTCPLSYLYKFEYQAQFDTDGAEHELCSVYIGKSSDSIHINLNEIAEWRYISLSDLKAEMISQTNHFTPWFKLEWQRLTQDFRSELAQYCRIDINQEW